MTDCLVSGSSVIRRGVSSNPVELDELHLQYPWIPSGVNIRPTPETRQQKIEEIQEILGKWVSMKDFLYFRIFGFHNFQIKEKDTNNFGSSESRSAVGSEEKIEGKEEPERIDKDIDFVGKFYFPLGSISNELCNATTKKFMKNPFPYNNLRCNHFVLWYGCTLNPYLEEQEGRENNWREKITQDIVQELKKLLPARYHANFQFIWYENPKMTHPDFYHVHVFWIQE